MWAFQKIVEKDDGILFKDFVINIQKTTFTGTATVSWQISLDSQKYITYLTWVNS